MCAVTEVANGGSDAVGVGTGQLCGDKPGHWGIGVKSQQCPEGFESGTGGPCCPGADATLHSRQACSGEERVDPVPEIDGFRFVDEVCAAGWLSGDPQGLFGGQVCGCCVFDVRNGHKILPCSDLFEATTAGGVEQFGDEVIVAGPPDQVRSQGAGQEAALSGGLEDGLFGESFGVWVVAEPALGVGRGFVCLEVIGAIEDHAGRAGVDESGNFVSVAGVENIESALVVDAEVETAWAPDAGHGGGMENGFDAVAGTEYKLGIADITLNQLGAGGGDSGVVFAAEDSNCVSVISQLFDDVETEKASATGNENAHGFAG